MTCIVGLVDGGDVWIGGDSAGVSGWDLHVRSDRKVFTRDGWAFGFTWSYRYGQIMRYKFHPPEKMLTDSNLLEYMCTDFVDALRQTMRDAGFAKIEHSREEAGQCLVGRRGRLFTVQSDYSVAENVAEFGAVGCGAPYALGAMTATDGRGMTPAGRVGSALAAAEQWSSGVRGPFHLVNV